MDFTPTAGHEQGGRRPALVLSPEAYNGRVGLALVCPVTTRAKGYPFEVGVTGSDIAGVILSDHVRNLDWRARRAEPAGRAPAAVVEEVLLKLATLLGTG
jgi:mRNA interferase MazF